MSWIKVDADLPDHPKVLALASELGIEKEVALGKVITWFCWMRKFSPTGNSRKFPYLPGWGEAVEKTGWTVDGWIKDWPQWGGAEAAESARRGQVEFKEMLDKYGLKPYGKFPEIPGISRKFPSRREEKRRDKKDLTTTPAAVAGFDKFWTSYPNKKSKGQALKAWAKVKGDELLESKILPAVEAAKKSSGWTKDGGQFIPHPATWLNAMGWLDEPTKAPVARREVSL